MTKGCVEENGIEKYGENIVIVSQPLVQIMDQESNKALSFRRDRGCLCIPIGWGSVPTFLQANRNIETTLVPILYCSLYPQRDQVSQKSSLC